MSDESEAVLENLLNELLANQVGVEAFGSRAELMRPGFSACVIHALEHAALEVGWDNPDYWRYANQSVRVDETDDAAIADNFSPGPNENPLAGEGEIPEGHPLRGLTFTENPLAIVQSMRARGLEHIVFVQNGYFLEIYDEDADKCSELFGWQVADYGNNNRFTGLPVRGRKFKTTLRAQNLPYIIIAQSEYPASQKPILREVYEVWQPTSPA